MQLVINNTTKVKFRLFGIAGEKEQAVYTGLNQVKNVYQDFRKGVLCMKREDLIKMGIDEDTAEKIEKDFLDELKGYIPKTMFDAVNNEKKRLETELSERDEQLTSLKNSTCDIAELKRQIETLQAENKQKGEMHTQEVRQLKIDAAVEAALIKAGPKQDLKTR